MPPRQTTDLINGGEAANSAGSETVSIGAFYRDWTSAIAPAEIAVTDAQDDAAAPLRPIAVTGNSANRVDIIILGDGYTSSQIASTYTSHIQNYLSYIFDDSALTQPFGRYENFFNVYAVDVVSNQSGADDPVAGVVRDTALDASYRWDGVTDRLLYVDHNKATAAMNGALSGTGIGAEMRYVLVNDTKYGGGGGYFGVYAAGNDAAREVALHEIGHSFAGLADEYDDYNPNVISTYTGPEPIEINVTKSSTGAKWAEWLGYNDPILGLVGAYEGARYFDQGIYRPSDNSKMRSLDRPFDAIAREEFVHRFYALVNPLDGHDNNVGTKSNVQSLSVDVIDPSVIRVDWTVDNQTFFNVGETFNFATYGFGGGTYTVTARAYDPTDWVRGDRSDLEQTVMWTVSNQAVYLHAAFAPAGQIGAEWAVAGVADFGGSPTGDVMWTRASTGTLALWNIENGALAGATISNGSIGGEWRAAGVGDFDNNGDSDIVWGRADGRAAIWQMDGANVVAAAIPPGQMGSEWSLDGVGDLNGDGKDDLVWTNGNGQAVVWTMDGLAISAVELSNGAMGSGWEMIATGDFTGNGRDDLLWRNTAGGDLFVWSMNGATLEALNDASFNGAPGNLGGTWNVGGVADFSGDGNEDIVWVNAADNDVQIWEMNDAGDVARISFPAGSLGTEWHFGGVAELTGDSTPDILWNNDAGQIAIFGLRVNATSGMESVI